MAGYDKTKAPVLPHEKSPEPPEQITPTGQQPSSGGATAEIASSGATSTANAQPVPMSVTPSSTPTAVNLAPGERDKSRFDDAPTALPESNLPSKVDASRPVGPGRTRLEAPEANPADRREETEYMMRNKPVDDDEARERKRNRARSVVAAIGDGVSALANLYFTTQYAPNANLQPSLSRQNKERYDKRMEEFRGRRKEYEAGLQRAKDRDKENGRYAQEWKYKMQQARQRQAEKAAEAAAKDAAAKAAADRHKEEMELKKADAEERKRHNEAQERNGARTARAAEIRASKSSRSGGGDRIKHTFRGKEYESTKDYTKDVTEAARDYNRRHMVKKIGKDGKETWGYEDDFEPIKTERRTNTGSTARAPEEYAGEVESRLAEEEKAQKKKSPTGDNGKVGKKSPTA